MIPDNKAFIEILRIVDSRDPELFFAWVENNDYILDYDEDDIEGVYLMYSIFVESFLAGKKSVVF